MHCLSPFCQSLDQYMIVSILLNFVQNNFVRLIVFCTFKMFRLVHVLICYSDDEVFLLTVTWAENFWNELLSRCYPFSMHQTLIQRASNSGWNAFHRQTSNRRLCFIPVRPTHNCVIWQDVAWTNGVTVTQSNFWYKYGS